MGEVTMKAKPRSSTRAFAARARSSTFLAAAATPFMLLVMLVGCQRSTEANGAISQDTPSADAAPAVAPADTPPAKQTPPAAGGDTSAAAAQDTGKAAGEPAGQASGDFANGWKQYEANCSRCHGQDALGSTIAPDLRARAKVLSGADFVQIVKKGMIASGMPAFEGQLADAQINDIYAYVMARSSGKLPPGRPAS
jgi:mono/diheme cytochrome c family protein